MIEKATPFDRLFRGRRDLEYATFEGSGRLTLGAKGVRVPIDTARYLLECDDARLEVRVDCGITIPRTAAPQDVIVFDPARFYQGIGHFVRLSPGQRLTLDTRDEEVLSLFPALSAVSRRKIEVYHDGKSLVFRETAPEVQTYVSKQNLDEGEAEFDARRIEALDLLTEILGGPPERLSADSAVQQLIQLQALLDDEPRRLVDSNGAPGAVVKLRRKQTVVVAGDLHGNVDNLLTLLSWSGLMQSLLKDEAVLVLLGDAVHPDSGPDLGDMNESVLMMDLIFCLKLRFPSNVYYVLGNHDSFSSEVTKMGVVQGLLWSKRLVELRGDAYRERLANIYASLPLIVYSPVFCACHAGPPQGKLNMEMMLNARQYPHLVHELTWTRQRVPGRPEGYTKKHTRRFRKALGLSKKTPFIVGHYPRDEHGCIWQDVGGIDGHHIVYSSNSAAIGAFVQYGERMLPQVFRGEPLTQWLNQRIKSELVAGS